MKKNMRREEGIEEVRSDHVLILICKKFISKWNRRGIRKIKKVMRVREEKEVILFHISAGVCRRANTFGSKIP